MVSGACYHNAVTDLSEKTGAPGNKRYVRPDDE
jgi:hypothetical protein